MIRCPRCGTMNSVGNAYCRNCREPLQTAFIECPQCGHANPEDSAVCARCNTPLTPTAEPLDIASKPSTDDDHPDWLTEITDETLNAALGLDDTESMPDWLADPEPESDSQSGTSEDDGSLDWLRGTLDVADEQDEPIAEEELPDWMQDFSDDVTPKAPTDNEQEIESGPVWSNTDMSSTKPESEEDDADWKQLFPSSASAREDDGSSEQLTEDEVKMFPDWLQQAASQEGATHEDITAAIPDSPPDWLNFNEVAMGDTGEEDQDGGRLPDWLGDVEPISQDERIEPELDAEQSWLSDLSQSFSEAAKDSPGEEPKIEPTVDTSWLDAIPATEPELAIEEEQGPTEDEWVSVLTDAMEAQDVVASDETEEPDLLAEQQPRSEAMMDDNVPDWLSDFIPDADPNEEIVSEPTLLGERSSLFGDESQQAPESGTLLNERAEAVEETPAASEGDDWLTGLSELVEPEAETETVEEQVDSLIPDWMDDFASADTEAESEKAKPEPMTEPVAVFAASEPVYDMADEDDTSSALAEEDPDADLGLEVGGLDLADAEESDLPDWLSDLPDAVIAQPSEEPPAVSQPSDVSEEDEAPVQADMPSWMQGLRPDGEKSLPDFPALVVPPPEDSDLELADIPDWVIALQPSADAVVEAPSAIAERSLPAENEGPLVGLGGVIPALTSVDMPEGHKVTKPELPQDIQKQAQLWQKLLAHPRFGQRPVMSESIQKRQGRQWVAMLTAFLLLAAIIAALLIPVGAWDVDVFNYATSYVKQSGVPQFVETIDTLQPGDVVVVVVDYGAGRIGEMTPIGETLVKHLDYHDVELDFVSSMPEGVMAAQRLQAVIQDDGEVTFLPRQASGITAYVDHIQEVEMIVVLTTEFDRLQWWVEQNASLERPHLITAGVSSSLRVMAAPYFQASNSPGWIAGYADALFYKSKVGAVETADYSQANALLLSHWLAAGLMLCGLFYYLVSPKKGTR